MSIYSIGQQANQQGMTNSAQIGSTTTTISNGSSLLGSSSGSSTSGLSGGGGISGGLGYHHPYPTTVYSASQNPNETVIRKVENGWILKQNNKEYVILEAEQVIKYLSLINEDIK